MCVCVCACVCVCVYIYILSACVPMMVVFTCIWLKLGSPVFFFCVLSCTDRSSNACYKWGTGACAL